MTTFDDYENRAIETAVYPGVRGNIVYTALGLIGEAGEIAEKVKKHWRATGSMRGDHIPLADAADIVKELGDVLWYVTLCAHELGITLRDVAEMNITKLADRQVRNVLKGSGDNR